MRLTYHKCSDNASECFEFKKNLVERYFRYLSLLSSILGTVKRDDFFFLVIITFKPILSYNSPKKQVWWWWWGLEQSK